MKNTFRMVTVACCVALAAGLGACGSDDVQSPPPDIHEVTVREATPTSVVIVWRTDVPTDGELRWGTSPDALDRTFPVAALTPLHRVNVDSLGGGTTYFYSVFARSPRGVAAVSDTLEIATPTEALPELEARPVTGGYDVAYLKTDFGDIVVRLLEDKAPIHVENFKKLAREGYYNGVTFHRVMPGFMIQTGSPTSKDRDMFNDMRGGPGYTLLAENLGDIPEGAVCAARMTGPSNPTKRSHGSQFFITVAPQPQLRGEYSVFGQVIRGMSVVKRIAALDRDMREDRPYQPVFMEVQIRYIAPDEEP